MSDKTKATRQRGLELYAVMKPWTYTDNDFNNRFNTYRNIQLVKTAYRGEMPTQGYLSKFSYKAHIDLPTFESGRITIPHRESIGFGAQKQIYGFAIYSKADSFYYYYFIKEHTKLMNGFSEYRIELNYFATYGEPCIYSDFTYKGTPPAPNFLNFAQLPPIQNPNIYIDRFSLIDEYLSGDTVNYALFRRFQDSVKDLPGEIDIESNCNHLQTSVRNVFGSSAGYYFNESNISAWVWRNSELQYDTSRGRIAWRPNGGVWDWEKYYMVWPSSTIVPDVIDNNYRDKINRSLNCFKNALDTDKFLLVNLAKNWWYKSSANANTDATKQSGLPDNNTLTLLVPLSETTSHLISSGENGFVYQWLTNMFGSGQITTDNILGCVRIKSTNFQEVRAIAMIEPQEFFFRNNHQPDWMGRFYICGFVVNSANSLFLPNIDNYNREMGWQKRYFISQSIPYHNYQYFNNPVHFNNYNYMLWNMYRFKGAYLTYATNDDKILKYDYTDFTNYANYPVLHYAPLGYENFWISNENITNPGVSKSAHFTNFAAEPWTQNEFSLGLDNSRLNHFISISSNSNNFWAQQRNAWQTASNQAKFNIGSSIVKGITGTVTGAIAGSVIPGVGTLAGAVSGGIGGSFGVVNSVQAYQNIKAQKADIGQRGGGNVVQGNSSWLRSRYINIYNVRINDKTRQDVYNFFATYGYNVYRQSGAETVNPNNARYLFFGNNMSNYRLLPIRVAKDSADTLMDNIRDYFANGYRIQLSNHIIAWLVNLFTHGITLRFNSDGRTLTNYTPTPEPEIITPVLVQGHQEAEILVDENNENGTGDTETLKTEQNDDDQAGGLSSTEAGKSGQGG